MPNFISRKSVYGGLLGICVKYNKNLFIYTFFSERTYRSTALPIFTCDGLKDADSGKEVKLLYLNEQRTVSLTVEN